ncbi:polyamine aminopropyltransferase [Magnetovibrio blakemorei]|uniref:Polyamine aminopropyltransferase n=1 Tax=Magnetovibrio blakemorei TaxID=28181 RepID=A0A1E5QAG9_9PROT|nr:polyamine aminopropyltransferase [Magnetovibrio blakemorei]OEJ68711.1 spermidine synthase [Magnetovibrio blakemorei]
MKRFDEILHNGYSQSFDITRIIFHEKTEHQELVIFETPTFGRVMALDNIVQVTTRDEHVYHEMLTHVPLLAKGNVKDVLIIGGGDGGILRETLRHASVQHATLVELDRAVVDLSLEHFPDISNGAFSDPRTDLIITDGVKFVAETDKRFDVVIVDSTDPVGPGEVLFTESFYADCHRCLKEGGVLVTQNGVPFFQGDEVTNTYQRMAKSFADNSFYTAVVPTYIGGFMTLGWASDDAGLRHVDVETLRARFAAAQIKCRYYTPDLHKAAFALPQFILDLMRK